MSATAIVGGQFGSEGKGLIAGRIGAEFDAHVRVGAANAGHTLYTASLTDWNCDCHVPSLEGAGQHASGCACFNREKHVMQQIPCGAYSAPSSRQYIGPGALISPEIFERELLRLEAWRAANGMTSLQNDPIWVDRRAHVITDQQILKEAGSSLAERIGSTSTIAREGIGQAQADRAMREESCITIEQLLGMRGFRSDHLIRLTDVPRDLHTLMQRGGKVMLEGTQGTGLSLTTGHFPYVTSRNTTAAGLCADAGVAITKVDRVIMVVRTYPIRVAGNSGPFASGSDEIDWPTLLIDPENERTTVTKKVRRVATFSMEQVAESARLNGATEIALTFADYVSPQIAGEQTGPNETWDYNDLMVVSQSLYETVVQIENETGAHVRWLGTGPYTVVEMEA